MNGQWLGAVVQRMDFVLYANGSEVGWSITAGWQYRLQHLKVSQTNAIIDLPESRRGGGERPESQQRRAYVLRRRCNATDRTPWLLQVRAGIRGVGAQVWRTTAAAARQLFQLVICTVQYLPNVQYARKRIETCMSPALVRTVLMVAVSVYYGKGGSYFRRNDYSSCCITLYWCSC